MFSSVGWGEILVLLVAALFIFGPDKLPGAVKQAKDALKGVRKQVTGARKQIKDEFADVVPDFDPAMLNPKEFIRRNLFEDDDDDDDADSVQQPQHQPSSRMAETAYRPPAAPTAPPFVAEATVQYDDETT